MAANEAQRIRNTRAHQLAWVAQTALEKLQALTGNDYVDTVNKMEDILQQTQNAPMVRKVRVGEA